MNIEPPKKFESEVSHDLILKFQEAYKTEFGEDITEEEAARKIKRVAKFIKAVYGPRLEKIKVTESSDEDSDKKVRASLGF